MDVVADKKDMDSEHCHVRSVILEVEIVSQNVALSSQFAVSQHH